MFVQLEIVRARIYFTWISAFSDASARSRSRPRKPNKVSSLIVGAAASTAPAHTSAPPANMHTHADTSMMIVPSTLDNSSRRH